MAKRSSQDTYGAGLGQGDVQLRHRPRHGQNPPTVKELLLCRDYGTTVTSISYVTFDPDKPPVDVHLRQIRCIANWPQASQFVNTAIPSVPSKSRYREGKFLRGYEVEYGLRNLSGNDDAESINCVIQLPNLLLDDDGEAADNDQLSQPREALHKVGITAKDAIRDYLIEVFKHTHGQLAKHEDFNETWEVELMVLDVAAETDITGREFSTFITDEPEAAVTFALRHEDGSNFIVCVAGGGTVASSPRGFAYQQLVRQEDPFRVDEIATPAGKDCGSSFINQAFIEETRERLAHIIELGSEPRYSKEAVLQDLFCTFEHELKRAYDSTDWDERDTRNLRVFGLREDPTRNFGNAVLVVTRERMNKYRRRSPEGTVDLVAEQLEQHNGEEVKVKLSTASDIPRGVLLKSV
ncbi:hypothetical protein KXV78_000776 [Aspergillus fumigatus]|nr:hypothetical protein KXV78_000776 [Aspergillus fumigatus]